MFDEQDIDYGRMALAVPVVLVVVKEEDIQKVRMIDEQDIDYGMMTPVAEVVVLAAEEGNSMSVVVFVDQELDMTTSAVVVGPAAEVVDTLTSRAMIDWQGNDYDAAAIAAVTVQAEDIQKARMIDG